MWNASLPTTRLNVWRFIIFHFWYMASTKCFNFRLTTTHLYNPYWIKQSLQIHLWLHIAIFSWSGSSATKLMDAERLPLQSTGLRWLPKCFWGRSASNDFIGVITKILRSYQVFGRWVYVNECKWFNALVKAVNLRLKTFWGSLINCASTGSTDSLVQIKVLAEVAL